MKFEYWYSIQNFENRQKLEFVDVEQYPVVENEDTMHDFEG